MDLSTDGVTILFRIILVVSIWIILSSLTIFLPQKFEDTPGDRESDALGLAIVFALFLGIGLSFFEGEFISRIAIELIGAYMIGIAIFAIDRRVTTDIQRVKF